MKTQHTPNYLKLMDDDKYEFGIIENDMLIKHGEADTYEQAKEANKLVNAEVR